MRTRQEEGAVILLETAPSPLWEQTACSCACQQVSCQRHLSCSKGHLVLRGMILLGWMLPGNTLFCASEALSCPGERSLVLWAWSLRAPHPRWSTPRELTSMLATGSPQSHSWLYQHWCSWHALPKGPQR